MKLLRNCIVWCGRTVALVCGLMLLAGCETWDQYNAQGSGTAQAAGKGTNAVAVSAAMAADQDVIRVGEAMQIEFLDITTPTKLEATVQDDGYISLTLGQRVKAAGKTATALQKEIHDLYVPALFVRLSVNIKRDARYIFVGGEVKQPGRYAYSGEMTVVKGIQSAGDFTIYANKRKIQLIRANGKIEKVDFKDVIKNPKKDPLIYPGDRIIVPLSPW